VDCGVKCTGHSRILSLTAEQPHPKQILQPFTKVVHNKLGHELSKRSFRREKHWVDIKYQISTFRETRALDVSEFQDNSMA